MSTSDEPSTSNRTHSSTSSYTGDGGMSNSPTASRTPYPKAISLNIGGRTFQTLTSTLRSESGLFHHQISDRFTWPPSADGSYFLNADPDLFAHLLRFMRRHSVFPLFYTQAAGFDYDLYNKLEAEAEYFQIDALCEWIRAKKYLDAISTTLRKPEICDLEEVVSRTCGPSESQDVYVVPHTRKVYICPRDVHVHRGDEDRCGAACRRARGEGEKQYEEETYVEVATVRKEIVFKEGACRVE